MGGSDVCQVRDKELRLVRPEEPQEVCQLQVQYVPCFHIASRTHSFTHSHTRARSSGYGPDGKGNCKPCKDPHCASCPKGVATCQFCSQESLNNSYGLVAKGKGKKKTYSCLPCPKGCYNCDGNNKICKDQKPSGK